MWRLLAIILEKYGLVAFGIGINIFCFYQLFTNHLKHMSEDIKENKNEIKTVGKEVKKQSNRISKIEGKIKL